MIYRQKARTIPKKFKMASKTKTNMRDRLRGLFFCTFWYLSIISGFFILICPILPLVLISPKNYRKWSDIIFGMWEPFPVAMMEVILGIRVVLSGDRINPFEGSLFVMNHRTRVDWSFLWLGLFHCCQPNAHNMKYVLKAPIMHVPGPGWVMQTCSFIFVHRSWDKDRLLLDKMLDYLNESDRLYQILLFPEGTDLSGSNIQKSHKYADEHNLKRYYNVLHPRTTGFAFLAHKMKTGGQLKAIYDITVAYPKTMAITEADLFRGKFPEEVHFHVRRYSSTVIPHQEEQLKKWLTNIWSGKEKKLQQFYAMGNFDSHDSLDDPENVDFGTLNVRNGNISYKNKEISDGQEINVDSVTSLYDSKPGPSNVEHVNESLDSAVSKTRSHINCDMVYKSANYRPSHILYLVLVFWITFILFTVYQLFSNIYLQVWVAMHSLLFIALSFVSNGFHHIAASIYFYRYEKSPCLEKKKG